MTRYKDFPAGNILNFDSSNGIFHAVNVEVHEQPIPGSHPYVVRTSQNNGRKGYICECEDALNPGRTISFAQDTAEMFWQAESYFTGNKVKVLSIKNREMTENIALFLITCLKKAFSSFGWGMSYDTKILTQVPVSLPVTAVMVPDWAALATLLKCHGGGAEMSKIDTSSWKKFKISELFGNAKLGKYHNQTDLYPDSNGYDFICASNLNNGINKDMPKVNGENLSLTSPNIIAWGKQCPMFTYHQNPCVTSQGMYYIELPEAVTEEMALFIITLLEHACSGNYGYNNCLIGSKFDDLEISLPVTTQDVPDWDYMQERIAELEQERIAELEQERIAELEQYLVAAGLNDYTLTENDLKVLSLSGSGRDENGNHAAHATVSKPMKEFRMGDVFEKPNLKWTADRPFNKKSDLSTECTPEFDLPLCNAKNGSNGIMYYGRSSDFSYVDGGLDIVNDGAVSTGHVYPQPHKIGVLYNAYVITLKNGMMERKLLEYLACAVQKAIKYQFGYDNKATWDKVKICGIILPIQTDESGTPVIDEAKAYHPDGYVPDWEYMAAYIRAMEKLVIRDVVDYKDEFIRQHRLAVAGSGV